MKWDEPAITRHEIVSMAQVCCAKTNVEEREWRLISLNLFAWVPWRWGCCRWRWWFWRAPLKWINELTDESCFRWQRHKTFYSLLSPDKLKAKSCSIYLDLPFGLMCAHAYPRYCELPIHGVCHSLAMRELRDNRREKKTEWSKSMTSYTRVNWLHCEVARSENSRKEKHRVLWLLTAPTAKQLCLSLKKCCRKETSSSLSNNNLPDARIHQTDVGSLCKCWRRSCYTCQPNEWQKVFLVI